MEEPSKTRQLWIRTLVGRVPLCGCGSTDTMWSIVRAVLTRSRGFASDDRALGFYDPMPELDLSAAAVEFAAQVLNQSDLMEHGSGIGWAWLTGGGLVLLEFLDQYGVDHGKWPEWVTSSTDPEQFTLTDEEFQAAGLANHHGAMSNG